jgi:nitroimidazol reductase NimA-like FMN-containing flavoprotein (pyridoxamine 5'-phosphate oxidase superfamily)
MSGPASGAADVWSRLAVSGPWSATEIRDHLEHSVIPLRLGCAGNRGPWVVSLWFLPAPDGLWIATQPGSFVARSLGANPACGFEIAGDTAPYRGVRGTGRAEPDASQGEEILQRLMSRYRVKPDSQLARSLRLRAQRELAFRIVPERVSTGDFRERMADALSIGDGA